MGSPAARAVSRIRDAAKAEARRRCRSGATLTREPLRLAGSQHERAQSIFPSHRDSPPRCMPPVPDRGVAPPRSRIRHALSAHLADRKTHTRRVCLIPWPSRAPRSARHDRGSGSGRHRPPCRCSSLPPHAAPPRDIPGYRGHSALPRGHGPRARRVAAPLAADGVAERSAGRKTAPPQFYPVRPSCPGRHSGMECQSPAAMVGKAAATV